MQIRIQMIFPQKQMKIEQEASIYLKKQALQLIISLYLTRKKDEDIQFLKNNFETTQELTNGIRSSILNGLSEQNIETNRITYGQNQKKLSQKCISFQECIEKQFVNIFIIISFFCLVSSLLYGQLANNKQIASSAIILIIAQLFIILTRILIKLYWSSLFEKTSLQKTKNNLYQVIRNGKPIQIMQSDIVVGDIIQLGFHEKVPATGMMISNKQVFLKQNLTQQKSSLKINLESCLSKIQNMSMLDLKLNFQNSSLPSPIVLRGSQLLKGSQYKILVISVSQENLLKQFKIHRADQFCSQKYDQWMAKLVKNWKYTSIYLICISVILLLLNKIADIKLHHETINKSTQIFFQLLLQISVLIIVLDANQISSFLEVIFIKMMNQLKVVSNFENLLTLKRILINQRKIVQCDQIFVKQLALCDKPDLITICQIKKLTDPTIKMIKEIQYLFDLKINNQHKSQKIKPNRIIHVNKRKTKIISIYSQSKTFHNNFNQVFKQIINLTENASQNKHKTIISKRKQQQKQKFNSFNFLKIPQLQRSSKQQQNLKQIIHSRCRIKSKSIIDGLVGIAQNGLRTYYFQIFDMKIIDEINFIIQKGKTILFSNDHKQKIVILSRKMSVVYNLIPIIIAFNQGSYNEKPARTLVCILGINILPKYDIINKLNKLEQNGIKSLIFIHPNHEKQTKQIQQNNIQQQYFNQRYSNSKQKQKQKYKICQASQIKNILNRLVCRKCRISNCNCTQKIQQVTNIQPFISISSNIKIIYNINDQYLRYIENAYKQIQNCLLCINSINPSTSDIIDSIFTCIKFVESLKRSVVLFYAVSIVYFLVPFFYWTRDIEIVSPLQIGLSYIMLIFFMFLCLLCQIKTTKPNPTQTTTNTQQNKQIKIITKQTKINLYIIITLILLTSWLFYYLHNFIPQYQDHYDTILKLYQLDLSICKYGINNSITILFNIQYCYTDQFGLQYSRISTIVNTYIYVVLWMFIVIVHQNLLSIRAVIVYILSICVYVVIVQLLPWVIHGYSEGLHWQHYVIIYISAAVTITIGYIIGYFVCKLSVVQYFAEQIQNKISFDNQNKSQYIQYLKKYEVCKKLKLQK